MMSPSDLPPRTISATALRPIANLAGPLDRGALRVAEIVQPVDQLPIGQGLPAVQLERPREDAGERARLFAVQPRHR